MKLKYDSFTKEAQCRNLKQFISRFHREKLQFILDVVMNPHTAAPMLAILTLHVHDVLHD